jgi:iron-only hydrogenase group A
LGQITEIKAACRGCHGGCVHILTVEGGKVIKIRPDPDGPLNNGHACAKGMTLIEQMYHPDRIIYPMKRVGKRGSGAWERISWDEAYDTIIDKLTHLQKTYGKECIATTTGTGRHHLAQLWRFANVLGTPNATSSGALICLGPRKNAGDFTAGVFAGVDYYGETKPACIIVWGANPAVSGADGELQWHIKDAVRGGTKLIVVDPQPNELTERAALWLRVRPGTDGALAMCILNIIISENLYDHEFVENWTYGFNELRERVKDYTPEKTARICWVPEEDIVKAAHMIASVKPLSLEWGCAVEQTPNSFQTCRAIYMIPAVTGNWDVPGGFVESKEIAPTAYPMFEALSEELGKKCISGGYPLLDGTATPKMFAHPWYTLDAIKTGKPYKIRALLAHANNSLLSMPDALHTYECLKELEFFVYMDFFMTPTAELADIVLPAALWAEVDSFFCMPEFGDQALLTMRKVADVGECRSDEEFFMELCRRMELDYGARSQEELLNGLLDEMGKRYPEYAGTDFEKLKQINYIVPRREYERYKKRGGFSTPSGKFELWSLGVEKAGGDPLPFWSEVPESPYSRPDLAADYPLVLTTGSRRHQYFISNNRQILSLRRTAPFPTVSINPDTAAKYGIKEGDWVWIETPRGRITQKASLKPELDPRVINCEMGWWYPEAGAPGYGWDESNVNVLTAGEAPCDPFDGSYQLRALLCRISKNENCTIEERYYNSPLYRPLPKDCSSKSVVIDPNLCILCHSCVDVCNKQNVGALEIVTRGGVTIVAAKDKPSLSETGCVGCGQCRAVCPTGAISVQSSAQIVKEALGDPETTVIAQIAPSVRVSVGKAFGLEGNALGNIVGGLRLLGFDAVYDTVFAADLTTVEEAREFADILASGEKRPLFTSCCPAWVSWCEKNRPELSKYISTCRSPQQMFGSVLREHFKRDNKRVVSVSVMPCTAKKSEIYRFGDDKTRDVDYVLTATELIDLFLEKGIDLASVAPSKADDPFGFGSGGGVIFGVTGGVTEAVLRQLSPDSDEAGYREIAELGQRGEGGVKEFNLDYKGRRLRIAVVSGLGNAARVMDAIEAGEHYDLVEIMSCPGGCVMGGGQPADVYAHTSLRRERTGALYGTDESSEIRRPGDNPLIGEAYDRLIRADSQKLLHVRKHSGL